MSMLREERKQLRDEMERVYGINLREDDELLPVIQFITEASKLADLTSSELKQTLAQIKEATDKLIADNNQEFKKLLHESDRILTAAAVDARTIVRDTQSGIDGLPKIVAEFKEAVSKLNIPKQIVIKQVSFEEGTMSFLWKYFTVSVMVVVISFVGSMWWVQRVSNKSNENSTNAEWLQKFYLEMREQAPMKTYEFTQKNPVPTAIKNLH